MPGVLVNIFYSIINSFRLWELQLSLEYSLVLKLLLDFFLVPQLLVFKWLSQQVILVDLGIMLRNLLKQINYKLMVKLKVKEQMYIMLLLLEIP